MTAHTKTPGNEPLLVMEDVVQEFAVRRRGAGRGAKVSAVANVDLEVDRGHALAIVGETGSGKTTLARAILGAPPPTRGRIVVDGHEVTGRRRSAARERGRRVQMVFQDPMSALDPTWSVERSVGEPLTTIGRIPRAQRRERIAEVLDRVGLDPGRYASRRPFELSGGQAQRVAIARALVGRPSLVICDEPVTALDASSQAQVVALLADLKREYGLTYLFIAHDLAVVQQLADRVATMYLGRICEQASTAELFGAPAHPYTAALLSAIPSFEPEGRERLRLLGEPPSPISPPSGCRFRTRCAFAQEVCAAVEPKLQSVAPGHQVACHFPLASSTAVRETGQAAVPAA